MLNRGEAVNALKRAIYTGRASSAQAKRADEMQAAAYAELTGQHRYGLEHGANADNPGSMGQSKADHFG